MLSSLANICFFSRLKAIIVRTAPSPLPPTDCQFFLNQESSVSLNKITKFYKLLIHVDQILTTQTWWQKKKIAVRAPDAFMRSKYLMIFLTLWLKNVCALAFELHDLSIKSIAQWSFYKATVSNLSTTSFVIYPCHEYN